MLQDFDRISETAAQYVQQQTYVLKQAPKKVVYEEKRL